MEDGAVEPGLGLTGIGLDRLAVQCSGPLIIALVRQNIGQIDQRRGVVRAGCQRGAVAMRRTLMVAGLPRHRTQSEVEFGAFRMARQGGLD